MSATAKQRRAIDAAYDTAPAIYDGFKLATERLFDLALASEKQYRKGRTITGFSASSAARYFAVKWLAEYASGRSRLPELAEIHRLRPDVVLAASYAAAYPEFKAWADSIPAEFWDLDYAQMMD